MPVSSLIKQIPTRLFVTAALLVSLLPALESCANTTTHHLSFIPEGMNVQKVLYSEEKAWGWGPGANETGVIVYELPSSTAKKIKDANIDYFAALPAQTSGNGRDWRRIYRPWKPTPITEDERVWFKNTVSDETTSAPKLDNYLNRYGFGIPIQPQVEDMVDKVISTPGSFYTYGQGGGGTIVVSPSIYRVFYIYSG